MSLLGLIIPTPLAIYFPSILALPHSKQRNRIRSIRRLHLGNIPMLNNTSTVETIDINQSGRLGRGFDTEVDEADVVFYENKKLAKSFGLGKDELVEEYKDLERR